MEPEDLDPNPLRQLGSWIEEARAAGAVLPEAMCVATAGAGGLPSARMVLMRGLDHGVVFYTDYRSDKAKDLQANPRAAAVFHLLDPVHRQIRVVGAVAWTSGEESDRYWRTRPVTSRQSALASRQSAVVESRAALELAVRSLGASTDPARPPQWGGFRITPASVEFWEEGMHRLHDRIRFVRDGGRADNAGGWAVQRLSP